MKKLSSSLNLLKYTLAISFVFIAIEVILKHIFNLELPKWYEGISALIIVLPFGVFFNAIYQFLNIYANEKESKSSYTIDELVYGIREVNKDYLNNKEDYDDITDDKLCAMNQVRAIISKIDER